MNINDLKSFNWKSLKKFASPKAADDLNAFLEKLPQNAGQTLLIMAGVVWGGVALVGLFTTVQLKALTSVRADMQEAKAIKPAVPEIGDVKVSAEDLRVFVEKSSKIYTGLEMKPTSTGVEITAAATSDFGQFREAIGHVQNGGAGWRVSIDKLCVGRECDRKPLSATLLINKVSVDKPSSGEGLSKEGS